MIEKGKGHVVAMSSIAGVQGIPYLVSGKVIFTFLLLGRLSLTDIIVSNTKHVYFG
jgi:hypothetical protein